MRINAEFVHNLDRPETKEQVCKDDIQVLELMYQAHSFKDTQMLEDLDVGNQEFELVQNESTF